MSGAPFIANAIDPDAIQVAVATDDGYAAHLTVMLLSLFEHRGATPIQVHALVPLDFKSKLKMLCAMGPHASEVFFHQVDASKVAGMKQRSDITNATYYRLLIGELLPQRVGRVIYLDCDMLVCGEISTLWETPLGNSVLAAVRDAGFTQHDTLGLDVSEPYFNAGMMLIDLDHWRRLEVGRKALAFAASSPERLSFNDQCALNWVMRGKWQALDHCWNLQAFMLGDLTKGYFSYPRALRGNANDARIVHFNSPARPWLYLDEHPFKRQYLAFRAKTPWADDPLIDRYPHNMVIKALRRRAAFLLPAYLTLRKLI